MIVPLTIGILLATNAAAAEPQAASTAAPHSSQFAPRLVFAQVIVNGELQQTNNSSVSVMDHLSQARKQGAAVRQRYTSMSLLPEKLIVRPPTAVASPSISIRSSSNRNVSMAAVWFARAFEDNRSSSALPFRIPPVWRSTKEEKDGKEVDLLLFIISTQLHELSLHVAQDEPHLAPTPSPAVKAYFTTKPVLRKLSNAIGQPIDTESFLDTIVLELWRSDNDFDIKLVIFKANNGFTTLPTTTPLHEFMNSIGELTNLAGVNIEWETEATKTEIYQFSDYSRDMMEINAPTAPTIPKPESQIGNSQQGDLCLFPVFVIVSVILLASIVLIVLRRRPHPQAAAYARV